MQYIKEPLRKKILETALKEFDAKGYDGASMRAIAEGAGTSLGNLYRYFRNKDDMYAHCLMPVLDECIHGTEQIFDVSPQALALTAEGIAGYVSSHSREFRIIVQGPARHYGAFLDRYTQCIARKLKESAALSHPHNPGFFDAVALAFISSLRDILEKGGSEAQTKAYVLELMGFFFTDFEKRLPQAGEGGSQ